MAFWAGILAPKDTDREVLATLRQSLNKTLADPEVRAVLSKQGIDLVSGEAEAFVSRIAKLCRQILKDIDLSSK
jgi:tripartite-type tricarboxylate transporter receptor subunit TctC